MDEHAAKQVILDLRRRWAKTDWSLRTAGRSVVCSPDLPDNASWSDVKDKRDAPPICTSLVSMVGKTCGVQRAKLLSPLGLESRDATRRNVAPGRAAPDATRDQSDNAFKNAGPGPRALVACCTHLALLSIACAVPAPFLAGECQTSITAGVFL